MTESLRCVFCGASLPESSTKRQHILHAAIGGTLTTNRTTCSQCNDYFAVSIDLAIAKKYSLITNALAPALKIEGPRISLKMADSDQPIKMAPGLIPLQDARIVRNPNGQTSVRAHDLEIARRLFKSTGNELGPKSLITYESEQLAGRGFIEAPLLHPDELRSIVKIAIEYLCHSVPELRPHMDLSEAISTVRRNAESDRVVPVILPEYPSKELRAVGFPSTSFSHRIWISCNESSGIQCIVDLFSSVAYRFRLGDYSGSERSFMYQKNILKASPEDFLLDSMAPTLLPPIPVINDGESYAGREAIRLGKLCIECMWHVDTGSKEHLLERYAMALRNGKAPGEKTAITSAQVLELVSQRLSRVFVNSFRDPDAKRISKEILERLNLRTRTFPNESAEKISMSLKDYIWDIHNEAHLLHRNYVGQPDYGIALNRLIKE